MPDRARQRRYVYHYPRPMVTVDLVVITPMDGRLRVLLIRRGKAPYRGRWALPGGFVEMDEPLEQAARRELAEETGLRVPRSTARSPRSPSRVWMEELRSFGEPGRDPRGRTITVAYLMLVRPGRPARPRAGDDAAEADWFDVYRLPELAFDHRDIIRCAIDRLRRDLEHRGLAFRLVPVRFTLTELRQAYEMILHRPIDPNRFRQRVRAVVVPAGLADGRRSPPGRAEARYRHRPT